MINRFQRFFEISQIERLIEWDNVDKLKVVEKDGVECLIGDDFMDYEKNYGD